MKKILLALVFICLFVNSSDAKDLYISQGATGSDTGSNCMNSHSAAWFNSASSWGASSTQISAGDTVHLCGTLTSPIKVQGSGTAEYPITILFEPNAKFSVPVLSDNSSFITASNRSYITIDGGTNGIIEVTNNGTALAYQRNLYGIFAQGVSNLIIQNLTINNLYKRTAFSSDGNRFGIGLNLGGSDITVQNCTLTGGDTMVGVSYGTGSSKNIFIRNNTIGQCNHGITIGAYQVNSNLDNVVIANNRINDLDVWEGNEGLHLDGMIIFNEAPDYSGGISNLQIYGNYIGPNIGNTNTAGIFIIAYRPSQSQNVSIYNNIFTSKPPYSWSNGFIAAVGKIYNNTIVAMAGGTGIGTSGLSEIKNNIIYIQNQSGSCNPIAVRDYTAVQINNNLYYCNGSISMVIFDGTGTADFYDLSRWKSMTGFDANSLTADPRFVNINFANFKIGETSPAIRAGVNLGAQYATDKNGKSRPVNGAWDIGAYQYSDTNLSPPLNFRKSGQ